MTEASRSADPRGERKQATVMFADIVESTSMIASLDAEAAMARLKPVVDIMVRAVRRFDGTVLRTLGDGLMATFGAPLAQERHALRACQAALAMQEAIAGLPIPTPIRIGLHSGEIVAGAPEVGGSAEPEVHGVTLAIANRIEQQAEPGGICLSDECRALVEAYVETAPLGRRVLKGISEPAAVFRLVAMRPVVASDQFSGGDLTRLRGRVDELRRLGQALSDAKDGRGKAIGIVGSAGIGKSRLCHEFAEACRRQGIDVLEARAQVFGKATPLLPVIEMLRAFFGVAPFSAPMAARAKITEKLLSFGPAFSPDIPILAEFLGLPAPELAGAPLDPKAKNARLRDFFGRLVESMGQEACVILLEDLHWMDASSLDFITAMIEAVTGTKAVIVVNYRPDWPSPWRDMAQYGEMPLPELDDSQIHELTRDRVGGDPRLAGMIDRIAARSGGNPFFAEELVRALAQNGTLTGTICNYGLAPGAPDSPALPATLEAVISARIDLLAEPDKQLLQIGAVIGKAFPSVLLQALAPRGNFEAGAADRLCAAELIQASDTEHGPGFAFRHPLVQEVAYAMQLRSRRAKVHADVAKAIETLPWGISDEAASLLAHHWEAAGQPATAAKHLSRSAHWIARTNSTQAVADWKKIRRLLGDHPPDKDTDRLRAMASSRLLSLGYREGLGADEVRTYAEEALRYARATGDRTYEALTIGTYGRILSMSGAADDYVSLARQAVSLVEDAADKVGWIACNALLSQAYSHAGLYRDALGANDETITSIHQASRTDEGMAMLVRLNRKFGFDVNYWVRSGRVACLVHLGQFDEAGSYLNKVMQVDPGEVGPVEKASAHFCGVELAWHRGAAGTALWHADELAALAYQTGTPYLGPLTSMGRGLAALVARDFTGAADFFSEGVTTARRTRTGMEYEARLLAHLAQAYDLGGDFDRAALVAAESISLARRRSARLAELLAHCAAAHSNFCLATASLRSEGENHLDRARELLRVTGAAAYRPWIFRAEERSRVGGSRQDTPTRDRAPTVGGPS